MYELLVAVKNPEALDKTVQELGGVVGQDINGNYEPIEPGIYAVRAVNPNGMGFLEFAIETQGYGRIVGKREIGI